jgi:cell wall-associated NlpC family hydrolase
MAFGFTQFSIVPIRSEAREQSEMVSQLLFGELYQVVQVLEKWVQIVTFFDAYKGWIDRSLHTEISEKLYKKGTSSPLNATNALIVEAQKDDTSLFLVRGSTFPGLKSKRFKWNEQLYRLKNFTLPTQAGTRQSLVETAKLYLNTPYLWGGKTPFGIDCSGFTQMVYRINGVQIPRDAYQQVSMGQALSFVEEAQAGDLAFFENEEGSIIHVGMVLENQYIIHASGHVRIDKIDHEGIYKEATRRYSHQLRVIQNILG